MLLSSDKFICFGFFFSFFFMYIVKDKYRLEQLKLIVSGKAPHGLITEIEEEWCKFHNLVQTSLHTISDICMCLPSFWFAKLKRQNRSAYS